MYYENIDDEVFDRLHSFNLDKKITVIINLEKIEFELVAFVIDIQELHSVCYFKVNNIWYKYNDDGITNIEELKTQFGKKDDKPTMAFYRRTKLI